MLGSESWINPDTGIKIAIGVISTLLIYVLGKTFSKLWGTVWKKIYGVWDANSRLQRAQSALEPSKGIWLAEAFKLDPPRDYRTLIDDADATWLLQSTEAFENVPAARFIPASYGLAGIENRAMLEWLLGTRKADVRSERDHENPDHHHH